MNFLLVFVAPLLLSQVPAAPPPEPEVTKAKVDVMEHKIREILELSEALKKYQDTIPDAKDVRERVTKAVTILKGRAKLLILMRERYEEALRAKYELEAELDLYARWAAKTAENMGKRQKEHEDHVKSLNTKKIALRHEANVAADLLRQKLEERLVELRGKIGNEEEASSIEQQIADLKIGLRDFALVPDREELKKPFEKLGVKELRSRLDVLLAGIRDADFEANFVRNNILDGFPAVSQRFLLKEQQEALQQSAELLKKARYLEDHAAQVAIVSRYVREWLQEMEGFANVVQKAEILDKHLGPKELRIVSELQAIAAQNTGGSTGNNTMSHLGGGLDLLLLPQQNPEAKPAQKKSK